MHTYIHHARNSKNGQIDCISTGESGLVYKGYLDTALGKELVALKTGKGCVLFDYQYCDILSVQLISD